ncbi:hypothetical protein C943_02783 [Mariniradius saccharolyticus AK6]|uniref:Uncharacterized protein n=1 Tax=Mariniradius saccharolyticus AK6 TaxID=1239962 RepID=M7Y128_9BACT|nr:hypothetical protein [Mariniradius saccharolyticus]EMS30906.1 hypothetical protein C943_02783 [Mariniradius saccharolyticus AK6]
MDFSGQRGFLEESAEYFTQRQRRCKERKDQWSVAVISRQWQWSGAQLGGLASSRESFFSACFAPLFPLREPLFLAKTAKTERAQRSVSSHSGQWPILASWRLGEVFFLFLAPLFSLGEAGIVIFGTLASLRETFFLRALPLHFLCEHRHGKGGKTKKKKGHRGENPRWPFHSPQSCNRGLRIGLTL